MFGSESDVDMISPGGSGVIIRTAEHFANIAASCYAHLSVQFPSTIGIFATVPSGGVVGGQEEPEQGYAPRPPSVVALRECLRLEWCP